METIHDNTTPVYFGVTTFSMYFYNIYFLVRYPYKRIPSALPIRQARVKQK